MNTKGFTGKRDQMGRFTSKRFKIGDKVKVVNCVDCSGRRWYSIKIGIVGVITDISNGIYFLDRNKYSTNFTANMLELVNEKEYIVVICDKCGHTIRRDL